MRNYKKIAMLLAVLLGGFLAFVVNQYNNAARAEEKKQIEEPIIVEAGCYGDDSRICFSEKVKGKKRTYYGTWQERTVN